MARSINTIAQQMIDAKNADSNLSGLTSNSKVAIWYLWIYIVASCVNVLEQLMDLFRVEIEDVADKGIPGTPQWAKDRTLKFQYDATVPQVLAVNDDMTISYAEVDTTKRVVTRCSVTTGSSKIVSIKVAKATSATDDTPVQLTTPEYNSLVSYWDLIGFAGITYLVRNLASDKISITATIYYNGQYSATIANDVKTAIKQYFAAIPFDGKLRVSKLFDAIQDVTGVNDLKIEQVTGRDDLTAYGSAVKIYDLATSVNLVSYQLVAGYCVEETTPNYTFDDLLTFVAQ
jgi:hypothetical protein